MALKNLKYQLIELCLDILSADGVADSKELIMLRELTEKLDLNFDEVQNMKDKAILNLDLSKNSQLQSDTDQDEIDVGMKEKLTKKEALDFIKNEFKKWNGRLNSLKDSSQREHAQKMLDALARLRKNMKTDDNPFNFAEIFRYSEDISSDKIDNVANLLRFQKFITVFL